jgi:hypothetical protein
MWNLKCGNDEKLVTFTNVIGRGQIRSFFTEHMWAISDPDFDAVLSMEPGDHLVFTFPNGIKKIEVAKG